MTLYNPVSYELSTPISLKRSSLCISGVQKVLQSLKNLQKGYKIQILNDMIMLYCESGIKFEDDIISEKQI